MDVIKRKKRLSLWTVLLLFIALFGNMLVVPNQSAYAAGALVNSIVSGASHVLAIKPDRTVWAWGLNTSGQLGDGTTATTRNTPVQVQGLTDVVAVSAKQYHSLALKSDGTVWAWGQNFKSDGTQILRRTPAQVAGLSNVTAIAAGGLHSLALQADGTVWAWGYNTEGQLGDGSTTNRFTPVKIAGLTNVTSIYAGLKVSYALKADGTLWAWGDNSYGQLGDGTKTQRNTPMLVSGLNNVADVVTGINHILALKTDGTVWAWGYNSFGQVGDGTTSTRFKPQPVQGLGNVSQLFDGGYHHFSLVLKNDGTVWGFGDNRTGQLGNGTNLSAYTPVKMTGLNNVTSFTGGANYTILTLQDGTVWATGDNVSGTLGNGTNTSTNVPVLIMGYVDVALHANAVNTTTVELSYGANGNIDHYDVIREVGGAASTLISTKEQAYTDTGLTPDTSYTYTVKAYDAIGNMIGSSTATVKTPAERVEPVPFELVLTATPVNSKSIEVKYSANAAVAQYVLVRDGNVQQPLVSGVATSYLDTNLNKNKSYTYTLYAYDEQGNLLGQDEVTASTSFVLTVNSPKTIDSTTAELSYQGTGLAVNKYVVRSVNSKTLYYEGSNTTTLLQNLEPGKQHVLFVEAFDDKGKLLGRVLVHVQTN